MLWPCFRPLQALSVLFEAMASAAGYGQGLGFPLLRQALQALLSCPRFKPLQGGQSLGARALAAGNKKAPLMGANSGR